MFHRSRFLGALLAASVGLSGIAAGVVSASPASASTDTRSASTELTGTTALSRVGLTAASVAGVDTSATLDTTLSWNQGMTVGTEFDPADVQQGGTVDATDSSSRSQHGTMVASWSLNDLLVGWSGHGPLDIGNSVLSAVGTCDLRTGGADYVCHLESAPLMVADTNPDPGIYVQAKISADVTVTPQGVATLRSASVGANPLGNANLSLGESPVTDTLAIACGATAGDHLGYTLGTLSTTPGISVSSPKSCTESETSSNSATRSIAPSRTWIDAERMPSGVTTLRLRRITRPMIATKQSRASWRGFSFTRSDWYYGCG